MSIINAARRFEQRFDAKAERFMNSGTQAAKEAGNMVDLDS